MVLFARSRLTYVLNMFSFIRRRRAADLLFYSGRKTSTAYVQQKFSGTGRTWGAHRAVVMLGLAKTRCEGPGLWPPGHWGRAHTARWRCHHKGAHGKVPPERYPWKGAPRKVPAAALLQGDGVAKYQQTAPWSLSRPHCCRKAVCYSLWMVSNQRGEVLYKCLICSWGALVKHQIKSTSTSCMGWNNQQSILITLSAAMPFIFPPLKPGCDINNVFICAWLVP